MSRLRTTSRRGVSLFVLFMLITFAFAQTGCHGPRGRGDGQSVAPPQDTDIYKVICFYSPNMWQSFDEEGDLDPEGFAFVMYLISKKTDRGAFVDGTLHIRMYTLDKQPDGSRKRNLVGNWSQPAGDAPQRARTLLGNSYQPTIHWGDIDVLGRSVQIVAEYESPTGRVVRGQTHETKVPAKKS